MSARFRAIATRLIAAALLCLAPLAAGAADIVIASTTSTEQSGLFGHILPLFTRDSRIGSRSSPWGSGRRSTPQPRSTHTP